MIRMTPIIPKGKLFDAARIARAIENGLDAAALGAQADFGVTMQTWDQRPDFSIEKFPGRRVISTSDKIYGYVNDGTPPHIIRPRTASILRFNYPTRAKTKARTIRSYAGSRGRNIAWARIVHHPGTAAREFTVVISEKWQKQLPIVLQRAINAEID